MKILKRGNDPANDVYKGICNYCSTIFECQRHEGKLVDGFPYDDGGLKVSCPVCGKPVVARKRRDDQPIPSYERDKYTWDSTARQIADIEQRGVIPR